MRYYEWREWRVFVCGVSVLVERVGALQRPSMACLPSCWPRVVATETLGDIPRWLGVVAAALS